MVSSTECSEGCWKCLWWSRQPGRWDRWRESSPRSGVSAAPGSLVSCNSPPYLWLSPSCQCPRHIVSRLKLHNAWLHNAQLCRSIHGVTVSCLSLALIYSVLKHSIFTTLSISGDDDPSAHVSNQASTTQWSKTKKMLWLNFEITQ